jgi:hypothetical protein
MKVYMSAFAFVCMGCAPSLSNRLVAVEHNQAYIENKLYHTEISVIEARSNMQKKNTELQNVKKENEILRGLLLQIGKSGVESHYQLPLILPHDDTSRQL